MMRFNQQGLQVSDGKKMPCRDGRRARSGYLAKQMTKGAWVLGEAGHALTDAGLATGGTGDQDRQ